MAPKAPLRISFVCTGNICRSPMAAVIFQSIIDREGLTDRFVVTSRGTHGYHIGNQADPRTLVSLTAAGYDGDAHRAAQLSDDDIGEHDILVALDRGHEEIMLERGAAPDRVLLLSRFDSDDSDPDVFDPYYSDQRSFDEVRDRIARTLEALLAHLRSEV